MVEGEMIGPCSKEIELVDLTKLRSETMIGFGLDCGIIVVGELSTRLRFPCENKMDDIVLDFGSWKVWSMCKEEKQIEEVVRS